MIEGDSMRVYDCSFEIRHLNLSVRTSNVLRRAGIITIKDLIERHAEVPSLRNAGQKTVDEVENFIGRLSIEGDKIYVFDTGLTDDKIVKESEERDQDVVMYSGDLDTDISDLKISVRSLNALRQAGYRKIGEILQLDFDDLVSIKNMGITSAKEILDALKIYRNVYKQEELAELNSDQDLCRAYEDLKFLSKNDNLIVRTLQAVRKMYPYVHAESFTIVLYNSNQVAELLKEYVLEILEKRNGLADKGYFISKMPLAVQNTMILDERLLDLERENKIAIHGDDIIRTYPSIVKYLTNADFKDKELVLLKVQGKTLEEIGKQYNVTRERIRQKLKKALKYCTVRFAEDKYLDLWNKYQISKEDFFKMFPEEKAETYYYLKLRNEKTGGKEPLSEIINDESVPLEFRKRYYDCLASTRYILINSRKIEKTETSILKYVMEQFRNEVVNLSDVRKAYSEFVLNNFPDSLGNLETSDRNLDAMLSRDINVLCIGKNKYRYHNFDEYDFPSFVEELDFNQYMNQCISANLFFENYPDLMQRYDLRDANEVHNYLKKGFDLYPKLISFHFEGRNPTINIGESSRAGQLRELVLQLAPIDTESLVNAYSEKYGDNPNTILGSYIKSVSEFLMDGVYQINENKLTSEEEQALCDLLDKDFYSLTKVQQLYLMLFPNGDVSKINQLNLARLGYKMYTGYVVSAKYSSAVDFINKLVFSKEMINLDDIKEEYPSLISNQLFYSKLYEKKQSGELMEFMPKQYISKAKLQRAGVSDEDLQKFVDIVRHFVERNAYFTIQSIMNDGLENPIDDYGFEDVFYESLLLMHPDEFSYRKIGGCRLFYYGNKTVTFTDFIEWILSIEKKIELDDLVSLIQNKYGIQLERTKVHQFVNEADVYFNEIYDSVYIDYDYYYEEI